MELIAKVERENESIQFIRISNKGMFVEIEYSNLPALSFILTNEEVEALKDYILLTDKNEI
jgi:hypothetical protein